MELKSKQDEEQIVKPYHDEGQLQLNPTIEMRGHQWIQQGYSIVCRSCPLRHAHFIGPDLLLVRLDQEGVPVFAKRKS